MTLEQYMDTRLNAELEMAGVKKFTFEHRHCPIPDRPKRIDDLLALEPEPEPEPVIVADPGCIILPPVIIKLVSHVCQIGVANFKGRSRRAGAVRARHIYFYAARQLGMSFTRIGIASGNRDHSTVLHGILKVDAGRDYYEPELSIVLAKLGIDLKQAA